MTPQSAGASYRRQFDRSWEWVVLRRVTGTVNQIWHDATARARVVGYEPRELTGGIRQGDRRAVVLAADLIAQGWPVPPRAGANPDRVVVRGAALAVEAVDDSTRSASGVPVAYELRVRG